MEKSELIERLRGYEWNDVEFKRAQRGVPDSAYETVSAFSNTEGGWLVFGIRDGTGGYEVVGVPEVDKVQNEFLSVLRSGQKLNRVVAADERLIEDDGRALLVFHIPKARRQDKPVYLGGDIRKSYIRRAASDERCTQTEIERLLRDAADERHDGEVVNLDPERCFDDKSLRWYRKRFDDRNPDHDETISHLEFLHHRGLVVKDGVRLAPTRAAVLLFGAAPAFRQLLPRPVVDWQWSRGDWSEELADERWADRLVMESNLVETWKTLVDRYMHRAEKPFSVDPETLQREDRPPDYVAFRKAAINLLIHQDYADHTRKAVIRFFDDCTQLWNPGDAYTPTDEIFELGEREVRNPRIVAAFRSIGLSEQAGTGVRAIFGNWQRLGRMPPIIDNDRRRKAFQLTLLKEELLSKEQVLFQASLGVHLNEAEARVFAFVCREGRVRPRDVRAVTGLSGADARAVLERLGVQGLVSPVRSAGTPVFGVAEHLAGRLGRTDQGGDQIGCGPSGFVTDQAVREPGTLITDQVRSGQVDLSTAQASDPVDSSTAQATKPSERLVTDQAGLEPGRLVTDQARPEQEGLSTVQGGRRSGSLSTAQAGPLTKLSANQRTIIEICDVPHRLTAIMQAIGVTGRGYFKQRHLDPLLRGGVLRMTHPTQSRHPDQAYVLTEAGAKLQGGAGNKDAAKVGGDRTNGA